MRHMLPMLSLILIAFAQPVYAILGLGMTPFEKACHYGADARVEFHVVDDTGAPVRDAKVNVFFDMIDRSKGRRVIGNTDTNGVFIAEAKTGGVLEIEVSGKNHYKTTDKICFIAMGREHEVKDGKWQPWGIEKKVVLLPVKNPCAIKAAASWRKTKKMNEWIGFDLIKHDFVKPDGKGEVSDIEVMFEWDGAWRHKEYNGMVLKIRFLEKFAGGYYDNKISGSEYNGVYVANPNANYQKEFVYSERVISRDKRGYALKYERDLFDKSKALVGRCRCILDEKGNFVSARYFQIENLEFACSREKKAAIRINFIYNPTPNDTNLEPKR